MLRRLLAATGFALVLLAVYGGATRYLVARLLLDPALDPEWARWLRVAFLTAAATPLLEPLAERLAPQPIRRWVAWPASLFLGFAFFLLIGLLAADGALLLVGAAFQAPPGPAVAGARALGVSAFALIAGLTALCSARRPPRLVHYEIGLANWPAALDGFRIVQISDLHIGPLLDAAFARSVADRVDALSPDLVAVTGDLVDGPVGLLRDEVAPLARLRAPHGVFFVTGNHDYYSGADPWLAEVERLGMRPLRNERVAIERDGARFELAGVDDHHASLFGPGHGEDVPRALAGRDPTTPVILLAHDPSTFPAAVRQRVDLQISGHTHGGQIWPFGLFVRAAIGFVAGHYRRGASHLIVSRGTGYWGPPMRLRAPAEIVEIVLRRAE